MDDKIDLVRRYGPPISNLDDTRFWVWFPGTGRGDLTYGRWIEIPRIQAKAYWL